MICPHCHKDNVYTELCCGDCGRNISSSLLQSITNLPVYAATAPTFSEKEIHVLLEINRKITMGEVKISTISQSDIDSLFD